MSFDIFFFPRRTARKAVRRKNPFTGQLVAVHPPVPLKPDEVKAIRAVLRHARASKPVGRGCWVIEFADGGGVEVYTSKLGEGCSATIRGLTPDLLTFLFDLLRAGDWLMQPVMEEHITITSRSAEVRGSSRDLGRVVTCHSAEELGALLTDGVRAWQAYRDQVVRSEGRQEKGRSAEGLSKTRNTK